MSMQLKGFAKEIWQNRYAMPSENNWSDTAKRVASAIAKAENDNNMMQWSDKFFHIIDNGFFMPGGRILRNAGRKRQSMINCFISELRDDVNSIGDFLKTTYMVGAYEGGFGYIADIRPLGAPIGGVSYAAPGVISTVTCIDDIGKHTRAGGGRRGAIWAGVRTSHPDVWYWVDAKKDTNVLNNHNISVIVNNDFIDAVEKNRDWNFTWDNKPWFLYELQRNDDKQNLVSVVAPDANYAIGIADTFLKSHYQDIFTNPRKKRLKARTLWYNIINNASHHAGGEPGIINESLIQQNFIAGHYTKWIGMNGCVEVTGGGPHDVCCLGHLNLSALYDQSTNDIDYKLMQNIIHVGVRFLDNVLTINDYPLPEIKSSSLRGRRIGLGFTGLAHLLIKMGIKYGSHKCINFMNRFMATIRNETFKASVELAKEKGPFTEFDVDAYLKNDYVKQLPASIKKDIGKFGIRNVGLNLLAPCGTISIVLDTSSSLEPIFAPAYKRKYRKGETLHEETLIDPLFEGFLQKNEFPDYFVGAYDVTVEEHLRVLSTAQSYLDQSISKTNNIPQDFEDGELADVILQYLPYIKSLTLYRESSRPDEPLVPIRVGSKEFAKLKQESCDVRANSQECLTGTCEV